MKAYGSLSRFFVAVGAALALAACGDDSGTGPSSSISTVVMLRNEANTPIVNVNISECSEATWGPNRLGSSENIAPGASRNFSVSPGCYDVRVSTATKNAFWYDRDVLAGDTLRLALSSAADVNNTSGSIGAVK